MLLAGDDATSDCCDAGGADVGLLVGGDWARRGVKQDVIMIARRLTIDCLLYASLFVVLRGEKDLLGVDDGLPPCGLSTRKT
jgi:hypothetical protein